MNTRLITTLALAGLAACAGDGADQQAGGGGGGVDLTGAGATFPYPLYSKWMSDYVEEKGVRINYQSIGSGGGIQQLLARTVDFGASDAPMNDDELSRAGAPILHFPMTLGSVAVSYNLPSVQQPLRLAGDVVADMFLGRITRWNDPRIAATNAGVTLPDEPLLPVHRSDGSGTTYVFTEYLSAVSPQWKAGPGTGKDVAWPTGIGAKGNEGVAAQIKSSPGTVGYIEIVYANQNRLQTAQIQNRSGNFVAPSPGATTAAAASVADTLSESTDYRISIIDAAGEQAYPISSFTWILVYRDQRDSVKARKLVDFLRWAVTDGQEAATALDYGPLPQQMRDRLVQRLDSVRVGGASP